jgi:allantoin racemase
VLGCMSMAFLPGICDRIGDRAGVPVVNPVIAALKTAETLLAMKLAQSKLAYPNPKPAAFKISSLLRAGAEQT